MNGPITQIADIRPLRRRKSLFRVVLIKVLIPNACCRLMSFFVYAGSCIGTAWRVATAAHLDAR